MGYFMTDGTWADVEPVTLIVSGAVTADGAGPALELGDRSTLRLLLDLTALAGTPKTLDVTIETSPDGSTWRTLGTFAQKTATGAERKSFPGCDRFVRARYDLGDDTTSATFSVSGEAV